MLLLLAIEYCCIVVQIPLYLIEHICLQLQMCKWNDCHCTIYVYMKS